MKPNDEHVVQLATRIPRDLYRTVKLHCVMKDVTIAAFVAEALRAKLGKR